MSNTNKNSSLSNMLRERKGEKKPVSDENHNPLVTRDEPEQDLRIIEDKRADRNKGKSSWKKNILIFVICIVLPVLSYYDYINLPFFGSADENPATEIANDFEAGFNAGYNGGDEVVSNDEMKTAYPEYLQKLNSGELGREFQNWEIDHLYESNVPMVFLEGLHRADMINRLDYWEITTMVSNGVTTDYLRELDRAGLFSKWEAWEIGNMYEDGVPASYLSELSEADVLHFFSAAELAQLFDSGITATELSTISEDLNLNKASVDEIVDRVGN